MRRRHLLSLGSMALTIGSLGGLSIRPHSPRSSSRAEASLDRQRLNRISFGAREAELNRLHQLGWSRYVEEQLHPDPSADPLVQAYLARATVPIEIEDRPEAWQERPLETLDLSLGDLWPQADYDDIPFEDWIRPTVEVTIATWIRALYSQWQLQEILVDFWHNHFFVNPFNDERISVTWPIYDRLIRQHCLGNFREFLGAVARSPALLIFLDNASSKASPANENFAREVFELHTLGSDRYLNHLYREWRQVPGAEQGRPEGYIDQDVYEAARAFTGWTVADGMETEYGEIFPNTGEFHYHAGWHDPYQKRILGVELPPNQSPLADGERVLDLLADHPGTAKHLCTQLCRRLVSDHPPDSLIAQAVATWQSKRQAPDQIQATVRTILLAPEFSALPPSKIKRPIELIVSVLRSTEAEVKVGYEVMDLGEYIGQRLFEWPTPAGIPDRSDHWLSSHGLLARWHSLAELMDPEQEGIELDLVAQTPGELSTPVEILSYWWHRLIGGEIPSENRPILLSVLEDLDRSEPEWFREQLHRLVALISMSPAFQVR